METMTTTVHPLPKSHSNPSTWATLLARQKALRLDSLLTSPASFSSTYEREFAFSDADWDARLRNPSVVTFIATRYSTARNEVCSSTTATAPADTERLLQGEWVGSAVLFQKARAGDGGEEDASTARFEIFGLFVLPEARGMGVGSKLLEAASAHGRMLSAEQGCEKGVVRLSVAAGNEQVLTLYRRVGFVEIDIAPMDDVGVPVRVLERVV